MIPGLFYIIPGCFKKATQSEICKFYCKSDSSQKMSIYSLDFEASFLLLAISVCINDYDVQNANMLKNYKYKNSKLSAISASLSYSYW